MQEITIYGKDVSSMEEIHEYFQQELDFPEYYGGNLSALYDMLTDLSEDTRITLNLREAPSDLMEDLEKLAEVLMDAQDENSYLEVTVLE